MHMLRRVPTLCTYAGSTVRAEYKSVADPDNMVVVGGGEGGGHQWRKVSSAARGVGERCKLPPPGSGAELQKLCKLTLLYAVQNHMEFQYFLLTIKIAHVFTHASPIIFNTYMCTYINLKRIIYQVTPFVWDVSVRTYQ